MLSNIILCCVKQVLCSALIFREDVDVGTSMVGDLHKKSHCVELWVEEMVHGLQHVRSTQLRLFNCGLGEEEAIDDIAQDVHCTRALLGEEVAMALGEPPEPTMGFVGDAQEAMSLESLDAIPMHCELEGVDRISTQNLSLTQLRSELQNSPMMFVSCPTSFSLLWNFQYGHPINATPLTKVLWKGPWFSRTPSLTLAIGPLGDKTMVSRAQRIIIEDMSPPGSACEQNTADAPEDHGSLFHDAYTVVKNVCEQSTNTKDGSPSTPTTCSTVSGVVEHAAPVKGKSCPPHLVQDTTMDDVLGRTTQKSDGRWVFYFIVQNINMYVSIKVVNRVWYVCGPTLIDEATSKKKSPGESARKETDETRRRKEHGNLEEKERVARTERRSGRQRRQLPREQFPLVTGGSRDRSGIARWRVTEGTQFKDPTTRVFRDQWEPAKDGKPVRKEGIDPF